MQESVTRANQKAKTYKGTILVALSMVFAFVVLLGAIIGISVKSKKYSFMDGQILYAYYTTYCDNLTLAQNEGESQKDIGGAGYIFSENGYYYICAFVYTSRADAESVCKKNNGGGVVEIKTQNLPQKVKKSGKKQRKLAKSVSFA